MKLSHELGKIFESEMDAVIQKEIDDPNYLPQSDFDSCEERATAMVKDATVAVIKTLAISIAKHREGENHGENHTDELNGLVENVDNNQLQVGLMGWWSN